MRRLGSINGMDVFRKKQSWQKPLCLTQGTTSLSWVRD
jgi:hypothetical protein